MKSSLHVSDLDLKRSFGERRRAVETSAFAFPAPITRGIGRRVLYQLLSAAIKQLFLSTADPAASSARSWSSLLGICEIIILIESLRNVILFLPIGKENWIR